MSTERSTIHLPGLNGLRAISALAVVVSHTTLNLDRFGLDRYVFGTFTDGTPRGLDLASYGVSIFFTISGFLITHLLLRERAVTGDIGIKRFYVRRMLRIWPLYYTYLLAALALTILVGAAWRGDSLVLYLLLLANIPPLFGGKIALLAHLWSIGVEEQFYLFWPVFLKWCRTRYLLVTAVVLGGLLLLVFVAKYLTMFKGITWPTMVLGMMRFQCMLIGCAGAMLWARRNVLFMRATTHRSTQLLAWAAIALIAVNHFPVPSFLANEVVSCIALALIMGQVTRTTMMLDLENVVLDRLGRMSYSIYVLHPMIILLFARWADVSALSPALRYAVVYGTVLLLTLSAAWLSYHYFEMPFLRRKERFAVVPSRSAMGNAAP